jgi:lipopolysaccharide transport system permease protein
MILLRILDFRAHIAAGRQFATLLRERTPLIVAMTRRDIADRYAGQAFGVAWAVLSPLLVMAVYLMAFGLIFKGRLGTGDDGSAYIAYMLAGLVPWLTLQEGVSRATTAISGQTNLVKQIVFPSEILPLRVALATLPNLAIGLIVVIPLAMWSGHWSVTGLFVLLPVCLFFSLLLISGLAFWLAAIGVFLRDIKDIIGFLMGVGLFVHPIIYPPGAAPAWLEALFFASPFSYMLWCFRAALVAEPQPTWVWIVYAVVSVLAFSTGWRAFRLLKPTFGNVL